VKRAADFLAETVGLDAGVLGAGAIDAAVRARCAALAVDEASLVDRLRRDPAEAESFLAGLLVHETWLFRDRAPFELLGSIAARAARSGTLPLRVLSFPCATGEEAWSIAATLLDTGLAPGDFRVLACDLEPGALRTARRGVYPERAFRGTGDLRAARLFPRDREAGGSVAAPPDARPSVEFRRANLLGVAGLRGEGPFDVVFCRNALVYMTPTARARVVEGLREILAPGGVLVVGHSEVPTLLARGFAAIGPPGAFAVATTPSAGEVAASAAAAFIREGARSPRPERESARPDTAAVRARDPRPRPPSPAASAPEPGPGDRVAPSTGVVLAAGSARADGAASAGVAATAAPETLEEARRLADAGHLLPAERLVRSVLRHGPDSAEAHLLLGVLLVAGRREAEARLALERALYLDPGCEEALLHLAALAERGGDAVHAARLRARAGRAEDRS
jgi:chemotaxis protein methyltransferase WspC